MNQKQYTSPFYPGDKHRKSKENRQLTMTLIFVCIAFLVLVSPILIVEAIFTFVNISTSANGLANVALMKTIFQRVCKSSSYSIVVVNFVYSIFQYVSTVEGGLGNRRVFRQTFYRMVSNLALPKPLGYIMVLSVRVGGVHSPFRVVRFLSCFVLLSVNTFTIWCTGRERLIRSHSSARFCFELSGNSN